MAARKKYGLIGFPLSHSFSKKYFTGKFVESGIDGKFSYHNFEIASLDELQPLIASNPHLMGFNVTIPYKEKIIEFMDKLIYPADEIGAVNTVKIIRKDKKVTLHGYNTDAAGFEAAITPLLAEAHTSALVLGTGGASKAVTYVLKKLKIPFLRVSRTKGQGDLTYREIDRKTVESHTLIINTTPAGTFPLTSDAPAFPYSYLTPDNLLFDLVYNPSETLFMQKGLDYGADVANGYKMLVAQAEAAWEIWNSKEEE